MLIEIAFASRFTLGARPDLEFCIGEQFSEGADQGGSSVLGRQERGWLPDRRVESCIQCEGFFDDKLKKALGTIGIHDDIPTVS